MNKTELRCKNAMNGKHRPVINARKTHYICEYCTSILGLVDKKQTKCNQPMKEAKTEQRHYAVAYCPECNKAHDVSTCDEGEIGCCGVTFYWSTVG